MRQYFSLYRAISQREGYRKEMIDERKNVQTTPTRTYCKRSRPLPYSNPNKQDAPALEVYPAPSHHALRGQGLTPARRRKIREWEERVHESGATVENVADLQKILKRAIVLRDTAGEVIHDSDKNRFWGNGVRNKVELIVQNGHAWSNDLHFPQSREVHFYEGNVWHAIREASYGKPLIGLAPGRP